MMNIPSEHDAGLEAREQRHENTEVRPVRAPRRRYDGPAPVGSRRSPRLHSEKEKGEVQSEAQPANTKPDVNIPRPNAPEKRTAPMLGAGTRSRSRGAAAVKATPAKNELKRGRAEETAGTVKAKTKRARQ